MITCSKQEMVSTFSVKCCMLYDLIVDDEEQLSDEQLIEVINAMFEQSAFVLGMH